MQDWNDHATMPTGLFLWSHAEQVIGNAKRKYKEYSDALELLTQYQVRM
jgi:hypothetical protein